MEQSENDETGNCVNNDGVLRDYAGGGERGEQALESPVVGKAEGIHQAGFCQTHQGKKGDEERVKNSL